MAAQGDPARERLQGAPRRGRDLRARAGGGATRRAARSARASTGTASRSRSRACCSKGSRSRSSSSPSAARRATSGSPRSAPASRSCSSPVVGVLVRAPLTRVPENTLEVRGRRDADDVRDLLARRRRRRALARRRRVAARRARVRHPALVRSVATAQAPAARVRMRRIRAFGHFWWDFVVGDDWRAAARRRASRSAPPRRSSPAASNAWWLMPVAVAAVLWLSLRRAASSRDPAGADVRVGVPAGERADLHDVAGVRRVDELSAADVDPDVAEPVEEDEVAGLQVAARDRRRPCSTGRPCSAAARRRPARRRTSTRPEQSKPRRGSRRPRRTAHRGSASRSRRRRRTATAVRRSIRRRTRVDADRCLRERERLRLLLRVVARRQRRAASASCRACSAAMMLRDLTLDRREEPLLTRELRADARLSRRRARARACFWLWCARHERVLVDGHRLLEADDLRSSPQRPATRRTARSRCG